MNYQPTPERQVHLRPVDRGLAVGRDPFGDATRAPLDPVEAVQRLGRAGRVRSHLPRRRPVPLRRRAGRARGAHQALPAGPGRDRPDRADGHHQPLPHPVFKDGAFTANDRDVRRYALRKTMRNIDLGAELGARPTSPGAAARAPSPAPPRTSVRRARPMKEAFDFLGEYVTDQGYDLRFAIEPKPNEPRGDILLPTVGHALPSSRRWSAPSCSASTPRSATSRWRGSRFSHGIARPCGPASSSTSTSTAQIGIKYDQDLRFGAGGPEGRLLAGRPAGDGRLRRAAALRRPPARTEDVDGVWDFARGCMRNYLILGERARPSTPIRGRRRSWPKPACPASPSRRPARTRPRKPTACWRSPSMPTRWARGAARARRSTSWSSNTSWARASCPSAPTRPRCAAPTSASCCGASPRRARSRARSWPRRRASTSRPSRAWWPSSASSGWCATTPTPGGRPRSGGRPRRSCSPAATVALGLEIGVDGLAVCIEDLTGAVRFEAARRTSTCGRPRRSRCCSDLARAGATMPARARGPTACAWSAWASRCPAWSTSACGTPAARAQPRLDARSPIADELRGAPRPAATRPCHGRQRGQPGGAGRAVGRRRPSGLDVVHPRHRRGRRRQRHRHRRRAVPRRARLRRRARARDRRPRRRCPAPAARAAAWRRSPASRRSASAPGLELPAGPRRVRDRPSCSPGRARQRRRGGDRPPSTRPRRRSASAWPARSTCSTSRRHPRRLVHAARRVARAARARRARSTRVLAARLVDVRRAPVARSACRAAVRGAAAVHLRAVLDRPWLVTSGRAVAGRPGPAQPRIRTGPL